MLLASNCRYTRLISPPAVERDQIVSLTAAGQALDRKTVLHSFASFVVARKLITEER